MKRLALLCSVILPLLLAGQQPIIIDHTCLDLDQIPDQELTRISQLCQNYGCAHSRPLNCVKKGIACWHLWARLAEREGPVTIIEKNPFGWNSNWIKIYPSPANQVFEGKVSFY